MKRILFLFLFILLYSGLTTPAAASSFSSSAHAAVLYQPDTNVFLYEKNSSLPLKMASTTKIMTALVAIESAPLDMLLTVPSEASGIEGTSLYLSEGDTGTLSDFLYALMLSSANDAAATIAINLSGSIEAFACKMNERAAELRLQNTHYENPHGLDSDQHYTCAKDLALLAAEALQNPSFAEIVATERKTIYLNDGETVRNLTNHNRLLRTFDGVCGVKTGFTRASGRCLVSAVEKNGVRIIAVTLDCPNDWQEHTALLRTGLSSFQHSLLAKKRSIAFRLPVLNGIEDTVLLSIPRDIYAVLPNDADIETRFDTVQYLTAPIKKGSVLGKVSFYIDGTLIAESPLTAETAVSAQKKSKRFFFF